MSQALKEFRNNIVIQVRKELELTQEKIGSLVNLSQGRISQLLQAYKEKGEEGIKVKQAKGAGPKLSPEQLSRLPFLSDKGAEHYGFEGEVWTRGRVGRVIQDTFGVTYTEPAIGNLLKRIKYSLQKPIILIQLWFYMAHKLLQSENMPFRPVSALF